jgi:hypothetical protein
MNGMAERLERLRNRIGDLAGFLWGAAWLRRRERWPAPLRDIVAQIRRSRVYVPSRHRNVQLEPSEISRVECAEAGEFLMRLAGETRRDGELLVQLSRQNAAGWS